MNFIEIHEKDTNVKMLVPVDKILSVTQCPNTLTAFIETLNTGKDCYGIYTTELYVEVKAKLKQFI